MKDQRIKRSDFAKIHAIACENWKETLEKWLDEQRFEEKITITDAQASQMYSAADRDQAKVLLKIVKRPESIFDKVKSYEDALKLTGDKCTIRRGDTLDEVAYKKLKAITKALNEGRVVDKAYIMSSYCYFNFFYFNSAGVGCVNSSLRVSNASAGCGVRLCFFTSEAAEYAAENFLQLYEQFYSS